MVSLRRDTTINPSKVHWATGLHLLLVCSGAQEVNESVSLCDQYLIAVKYGSRYIDLGFRYNDGRGLAVFANSLFDGYSQGPVLSGGCYLSTFSFFAVPGGVDSHWTLVKQIGLVTQL